DMDVAVDQPRHQGAPAEVDDARVRRPDAGLDGRDEAILDQKLAPANQVFGSRIEEGEVSQQDLRHDGRADGDRRMVWRAFSRCQASLPRLRPRLHRFAWLGPTP